MSVLWRWEPGRLPPAESVWQISRQTESRRGRLCRRRGKASFRRGGGRSDADSARVGGRRTILPAGARKLPGLAHGLDRAWKRSGAMADLTISNPQPFVTTVALDLGSGLETRNLGYNETWVLAAPEQPAWIAFFLLESGELLAQGQLAAGSTTGQLLLEQPYDLVLRTDEGEPLEIANGLDIPIRVDVLPVGSPDILSRELNPAGE